MVHKVQIYFFGLLVMVHMHVVSGENVTQPIGTLVRNWAITGTPPLALTGAPPYGYPVGFTPASPIGEVNYICAQWDDEEVPITAPYDTRYPASEIILTQPQHFVRLLVSPTSSSNGAWIMRSEYVRGKTPAQLKDIFALAGQPLEIVNVEMPASPDPVTGKNYVLWTGVAGPINTEPYLWGDGGAVQNRLVVDAPATGKHTPATTYFPTYGYTSALTRNHRQPIGRVALAYRPLAGCGDTKNVAVYLDTYIPKAYSDLENVYHALDYLNYIPYGSGPLKHALRQIMPSKYAALTFLNFRNGLLFGNALLDGNFSRREKSCCSSTYNFFIRGIGEFDDKTKKTAGLSGFCAQSGGILANFDLQVNPEFVCGVGAAGIWNHFAWQTGASHIHGQGLKIGLYASYCKKPSEFFIDAALCGGGIWNKAARSITFTGVDRHAYSSPKGSDFEVHVQGGKTFIHILTPIVRCSYLLNHQSHFAEHAAQSLNLQVYGFNAHTLRTYLGLQARHGIAACKTCKIVPNASLAWVNDIMLNKRQIAARITGPKHHFSVGGMYRESGYCALDVGCNMWIKNCSALSAKYDVEVRPHFVAQAIKFGVEASF